MGRESASLLAAERAREKRRHPLPERCGEKDRKQMDMNSTMGKNKVRHRRGPLRSWLLMGTLALGTAATVAACSSSPSSTPAGSPASSAPAGGSSAASTTISAKSVPGVGTVLVNGQGQTLYMLTSEKGGKITCTPGERLHPDLAGNPAHQRGYDSESRQRRAVLAAGHSQRRQRQPRGDLQPLAAVHLLR